MQKEERIEWLKKFKNNLILFGQKISPSTFGFETPKFHYELAAIIMNRIIKFICIEAPRGFAKSTIVACFFVIHHLIFDKGKKYIVIQSKTKDEAIKRLRTVKNILEFSEFFIQCFGYWGEQTSKIWREDYVLLKDGSVIQAKGTGQQLRGLKEGDQRPTLLILDDPEDELNTRTDKAMNDNFDLLLAGIPGLDSTIGRCIVIGTPLNQKCIVERLSNMDMFEFRHYQSIDEDNNSCLWPEMYSYEDAIKEKKSLEEAGRLSMWYSERQCIVTGKEDQIFKQEDVRYYEGNVSVDSKGDAFLNLKKLHDETRNEEIAVNLFFGIDPATSVLSTADYTVIMPIAVDKLRNFYVLPFIRRRMRPSETLDMIKSEYKRLKPKRVTIETTGAQETFRDILRNLDDIYIPGLGSKNNPKDKKDKRYLEILQPYHRQHKIYILKSMTELEDEMVLFPRAKHDDTIDALYWAIKKAYVPDHQVELKLVSEVNIHRRYDPTRRNNETTSWMAA